MPDSPTPPPPSETPVDDGSPNWAAKIRGDLAARGYERINDPRARESRTEIKQRVIQAGGTMDEAFEEIKRVEIQPPPSETKLSEALDKFDALTQEVGRRVASRDAILKQDVLDAKNAARSSLESLYREQIANTLTVEEANAIILLHHAYCVNKAPRFAAGFMEKLRRISSKATSEEL